MFTSLASFLNRSDDCYNSNPTTKWTVVIYNLKLFVNWPEDNKGHQSTRQSKTLQWRLLNLHETSESFKKLY